MALDYFRSVPSRLQQRGLAGLAADQGEIDAEEERRKQEEERQRQLEQLQEQYEKATAQSAQQAQGFGLRDTLLDQARERFEELTGEVRPSREGPAEAAAQTYQAAADTVGRGRDAIGGAFSGLGSAVRGTYDAASSAAASRLEDLGEAKDEALDQAPVLGGLRSAQRQGEALGMQGTAPQTLAGLRRQGQWDETQERDRALEGDVDAARRSRDAEAYQRAVEAQNQRQEEEGGFYPSALKRAGRGLGLAASGVLGQDTSAPGSRYKPTEERPVLDAQGNYTGRNETVEAPQGLPRIKRDVEEQIATVAGQGKRNENPLERAQAAFGLAMTPFNAAGEVASAAMGEMTDDQIEAAKARLVGDVVGPGGPLMGMGRALDTGLDVARLGVGAAKQLHGWQELLRTGSTALALAAAPPVAAATYLKARQDGATHEEAAARAIEMGGNVAQGGDIADALAGLGRVGVAGVRKAPDVARAGAEAIRQAPAAAGRAVEALPTAAYDAAGLVDRGVAAASPRGILEATGNITPEMTVGEGIRGTAERVGSSIRGTVRGTLEDLGRAREAEGQRPATALAAKEQRAVDPEVQALNRRRGELASTLGKAGVRNLNPQKEPAGLAEELRPVWEEFARVSEDLRQRSVARTQQAQTAEATLAEPGTSVTPAGVQPRGGRGGYETPVEATPLGSEARATAANRGYPENQNLNNLWGALTSGEQAPFFSQLERAASALRDRMAPAQVTSVLRNTPGVKPDQMRWSGLDDFLATKLKANEAVSRQEVVDWLQQHDVRVYEVEQGNVPADPAAAERLAQVRAEYDRVRLEHNEAVNDAYAKIRLAMRQEGFGDQGARQLADRAAYRAGPGETLRQAVDHAPEDPQRPAWVAAEQALLRTQETRQRQDALYAEHQDLVRQTRAPENLPGGRAEWGRGGYAWPGADQPHANYREYLLTLGPRSTIADQRYGTHWSEKNVIAHVRVSDRVTPDGKRVLAVEELQSDWHQQAQDKLLDERGRPRVDEQGKVLRRGYYPGVRTAEEFRQAPEFAEYERLQGDLVNKRTEAEAVDQDLDLLGKREAMDEAEGRAFDRIRQDLHARGVPDNAIPLYFKREALPGTTRQSAAALPSWVVIERRFVYPEEEADAAVDLDVFGDETYGAASRAFTGDKRASASLRPGGEGRTAREPEAPTLVHWSREIGEARAAHKEVNDRQVQEIIANQGQPRTGHGSVETIATSDYIRRMIRYDPEADAGRRAYEDALAASERAWREVSDADRAVDEFKRAQPDVVTHEEEVELEGFRREWGENLERATDAQAQWEARVQEFNRLFEEATNKYAEETGLDQKAAAKVIHDAQVPPDHPDAERLNAMGAQLMDIVHSVGGDLDRARKATTRARQIEVRREQAMKAGDPSDLNRPPAGPFSGAGWQELAVKRVLQLAAEGGYDYVGWTPGDVHTWRYDPFAQAGDQLGGIGYDASTQEVISYRPGAAAGQAGGDPYNTVVPSVDPSPHYEGGQVVATNYDPATGRWQDTVNGGWTYQVPGLLSSVAAHEDNLPPSTGQGYFWFDPDAQRWWPVDRPGVVDVEASRQRFYDDWSWSLTDVDADTPAGDTRMWGPNGGEMTHDGDRWVEQAPPAAAGAREPGVPDPAWFGPEIGRQSVKPQDLHLYVGSEIAQILLDPQRQEANGGVGRIAREEWDQGGGEGEFGLTTERGAGMNKAYNEILTATFDKEARRWGAKATVADVTSPERAVARGDHQRPNEEAPGVLLDPTKPPDALIEEQSEGGTSRQRPNYQPAHLLPVTPEMRGDLTRPQSLPLFMRQGAERDWAPTEFPTPGREPGRVAQAGAGLPGYERRAAEEAAAPGRVARTPAGRPRSLTQESGPGNGDAVFFSQLEQTLDSPKLPENMQARWASEQLRKLGVKPEEMRWTGLDDFLAPKIAGNERITKTELREFVAANRAEVVEVALGTDPVKIQAVQEAQRRLYDEERSRLEEDDLAAEAGQALVDAGIYRAALPGQAGGRFDPEAPFGGLQESGRVSGGQDGPGSRAFLARLGRDHLGVGALQDYDSPSAQARAHAMIARRSGDAQAQEWAAQNPADLAASPEYQRFAEALEALRPRQQQARLEREGRIEQARQDYLAAKDALHEAPRQGRQGAPIDDATESPDAPRWNRYSSAPSGAGAGQYGAAAGYREFVILTPPQGAVGRRMGETYEHGHWQGLPNPIVHVRATVRTLPDGRRVLFVEEVQSDLHQAAREPVREEGTGRKVLHPVPEGAPEGTKGRPVQRGYRKPGEREALVAQRRPLHDEEERTYQAWQEARRATLPAQEAVRAQSRARREGAGEGEALGASAEEFRRLNEAEAVAHRAWSEARSALRSEDAGVMGADAALFRERLAAVEAEQRMHREAGARRAALDLASRHMMINDALRRLEERGDKRPPEAPWSETSDWAALALKRMFRVAADEGLDGIALTGGENAAKRVGAAQQIAEISYDAHGMVRILDRDGKRHQLRLGEEALREHVGDAIADRLLEKMEQDQERVEQAIQEEETVRRDEAMAEYREEYFNDHPDATEEDWEDYAERQDFDIDFDGLDQHVDPAMGELTGEELQGEWAGNTGMIKWYDTQLRDVATKLGKKFGTVGERARIEAPGSEFADDQGMEDVLLIPLPPEAAAKARQPQPLFLQDGRPAPLAPSRGAGLRGEDLSTLGGAAAGAAQQWREADEEDEERRARGERGLSGVERVQRLLKGAGVGGVLGRTGARGARLARVINKPGAERGQAALDLSRSIPGLGPLSGRSEWTRGGSFTPGAEGVTTDLTGRRTGRPFGDVARQEWAARGMEPGAGPSGVASVAQPVGAWAPGSQARRVADAFDNARARGDTYPTDQELGDALLQAAGRKGGLAPGAFHTGRPATVAALLEQFEAGKHALRWYQQVGRTLADLATDPATGQIDAARFNELAMGWSAGGLQTTPTRNLAIALAFPQFRDDLQQRGEWDDWLADAGSSPEGFARARADLHRWFGASRPPQQAVDLTGGGVVDKQYNMMLEYWLTGTTNTPSGTKLANYYKNTDDASRAALSLLSTPDRWEGRRLGMGRAGDGGFSSNLEFQQAVQAVNAEMAKALGVTPEEFQAAGWVGYRDFQAGNATPREPDNAPRWSGADAASVAEGDPRLVLSNNQAQIKAFQDRVASGMSTFTPAGATDPRDLGATHTPKALPLGPPGMREALATRNTPETRRAGDLLTQAQARQGAAGGFADEPGAEGWLRGIGARPYSGQGALSPALQDPAAPADAWRLDALQAHNIPHTVQVRRTADGVKVGITLPGEEQATAEAVAALLARSAGSAGATVVRPLRVPAGDPLDVDTALVVHSDDLEPGVDPSMLPAHLTSPDGKTLVFTTWGTTPDEKGLKALEQALVQAGVPEPTIYGVTADVRDVRAADDRDLDALLQAAPAARRPALDDLRQRLAAGPGAVPGGPRAAGEPFRPGAPLDPATGRVDLSAEFGIAAGRQPGAAPAEDLGAGGPAPRRRGALGGLGEAYDTTARTFGDLNPLPRTGTEAAGAVLGGAAGGAEEALREEEGETGGDRAKRILGGVAGGAVAGMGVGRTGRRAIRRGREIAGVARMLPEVGGGPPRDVLGAAAGAPGGGTPPPSSSLGAGLRDVGRGVNSVVRLSALTSPLTHLRNVTQGGVAAIEQPFERLLASGLDDLIAKVRSEKGATYAGEKVEVGEAARMARATLGGIGKAWAAGLQAAAGRTAQSNLQQTQGLTRMETRAGRAFERVTDKGFAPIQFVNGFFNELSRNAELEALAHRRGKATGRRTEDVLSGVALNPTHAGNAPLLKRAEGAAEYRSLQTDMDALGKLVSRVADTPVVGPALMPFFKTPYNAVRYGLERMPGTSLIELNKKWRDPTASNAEVAEQAARATYGLLLTMPFLALYAAGNLTGAEPANATERDEWQAEGKQPYSMKINGRWVSMNLFPGIHDTLVASAGIGDTVKRAGGSTDDEAVLDSLFANLLTVGREAVQRPAFGGITDLLGAMDDPERSGGQVVENVTANLAGAVAAPALSRYVADVLDPAERRASGVQERLMRGQPGARESLPVARTHVGDERIRDEGLGGYLGRALNPLRTTKARPERAFYEHRMADSAEEDRLIRQAKVRVDQWRKKPAEYPEPSDDDFKRAQLASNKDSEFARLRSLEQGNRRYEAQQAKGRSRASPLRGMLGGIGARTGGGGPAVARLLTG